MLISFLLYFRLIVKEVPDMNSTDEVIQVISIGLIVASFLLYTGRVPKAIKLCKECFYLLTNTGAKDENLTRFFYKVIYSKLLQAHSLIKDYTNVIKYATNLVRIHHECGERQKECWLSITLAEMHLSGGKYAEAKELCEKALHISTAVCQRNLDLYCYEILGKVYQLTGEYEKARENHEKALAIQKENGNRNGEASCYGNLGIVFQSIGKYKKAREYHEKALVINKDTGERDKEAFCYSNLGAVYQSVGEYEKAREHLEKSLAINKEIGNRNGEAACCGNLGTVYQSVGEYKKAREHFEKTLAINKEIGDRHGETYCYGNLGNVYKAIGEIEKAKEHYRKSLAISKEIGDRDGEASSWINLGVVFYSVGEYGKAREYHEKALSINEEIGNKKLEASSYGNLALVFQSYGDFEKAREYHEKALVIQKEICDKSGEASSLGNLGILFESVGENEKAMVYYEKALVINKGIGNQNGEATCCENLGTLFHSLGKYAKTNEYLQKALKIRKKIGDRRGEASIYGNLGVLFLFLGDYAKAKDYHEKALAIRKVICDRNGEALDCQNLGIVFQFLKDYEKAEEYLEKGLSVSQEIGHVVKQFSLLCKIAWVKVLKGNTEGAVSYLLSGVQKCEDLRGFLRDNDQFKISFTDQYASAYWLLSALFHASGNFKEALYVSELGRARALADLMSAQYSIENQLQISANPQTWVGIESIMDKEPNSTCLYVSYSCDSVTVWILKASGVVLSRRKHYEDGMDNLQRRIVKNLNDFFVNESFRSFFILPEEHCEDRSLDSFQRKPKPREEGRHDVLRFGEDGKGRLGPNVNLSLCYKLIIAPVVDLLETPEIIIVPERSLYNIPFAALTDESGKCLAENFRIRIAPSLTILKLIQDSPAEHHCQTGALIVGNPDVGQVHFKGRLTDITRLPCAETEARMVGRKLGVEPLLGQQATKKAVLEAMNSVALIHIAAHGDAERGEIALAPSFRIPNGIPQEGLYLLTMTDIAKAQLRAKLVVLSCCHSARGLTKAEGAVGIARAFLGSGARSVLVALWALEDKTTEQLMSHFYDHLVAGESAGKSLHEAMKWLRSEGCDVNQWAPFILIGDDVTFDFGRKGVGKNDQDGSE
ncbi:tetratricopeptide repeat protein 28-like isoform X1 [Orbicella faveolata]|uniref:tetratricopeptide repeat protein 28-like isoform X1 n=1 Tax=Orbicella faveolata TaxID=48498 RepID=UPI0009E6548D|nr:tetratricopeptide repeat protein 28-like isoform X1 [Orbicella faveolata]